MFFAPAPVVACVAVAVNVVSVEKVSCVSYHPWHDRLLAGNVAIIVVLELCSDCSDLSGQCSVKSFNASL